MIEPIEPIGMTKGTETSIRAVAEGSGSTQPTRKQLCILLQEIDALRLALVDAREGVGAEVLKSLARRGGS